MQTIGVDIGLKLSHICDRTVRTQIWDTAGAPRFRALSLAYVRGAHCVMLFFDARRRETLAELSALMVAFKDAVSASCVYVVVCAKCEPRERVVSEEEGCAFAKSINAMYTEFSAATMNQHDTIRLFDTVLETVVVHIDEAARRTAAKTAATDSSTSAHNRSSNTSTSALSCFAMTLRTMFLCSACAAPSQTPQQPQQRTASTVAAGVKQYIARECPCFECNKIPLRASTSTRLAALQAAH